MAGGVDERNITKTLVVLTGLAGLLWGAALATRGGGEAAGGAIFGGIVGAIAGAWIGQNWSYIRQILAAGVDVLGIIGGLGALANNAS